MSKKKSVAKIAKRENKYERMLDDPNVKRWYSNIAKTSTTTADVYLRTLGKFLNDVHLTPKAFAALKIKKMEDVVQDYVDGLESAKSPKTGGQYAPSYIERFLKSAKSWSRWNGKRIERQIKIKDITRRPRTENEKAPEPTDLKKVLYADTTPIRTRAMIALMAFTGIRPEVMGNHLGTDGLKVKDLPDLQVVGKKVNFRNIPARVVVRREISKSRRQYLTFLSEEGCDTLKEFLERRLRENEQIEPDTGIVITTPSHRRVSERFKQYINDASPFLRTTKVSDEIRTAMRRMGFNVRPYIWRIYFDTCMEMGKNKGLISESYQRFFMGHRSDVEATYTVNKYRLPDQMVEQMREAYRKVAETYLQTKAQGSSRKEMIETWWQQYLKASGFTDKEIGAMGNLGEKSAQEINSIIREHQKRALGLNGHGNQKVVEMAQVRPMVEEGWEFVSPLPDGSAIVRLPTF